MTPAPAASAREPGPLPCPWCGGTPAISKYQTDEDGNEAWAVACDCKRALEDQPYTERYASAHGSTESAAIAAWNARPSPAEPPGGVVPVECWAVLDPDGNIDIDNVWRSDEMAEWASELHGVEKIRVRITPIATPKERLDAE